jgi:hypothetical protein
LAVLPLLVLTGAEALLSALGGFSAVCFTACLLGLFSEPLAGTDATACPLADSATGGNSRVIPALDERESVFSATAISESAVLWASTPAAATPDWVAALPGSNPKPCKSETNNMESPRWSVNEAPHYVRHWSSPCTKMSRGRSIPMNTILLTRSSPAAHRGPRSLPMSWCTPWKMTFRSVPSMFSTPL